MAGLIFVSVTAALAAPSVSWLLRSWRVHPYYSHGPILAGVAVYLVWRARATLTKGEASWWALIAVAAGAAVVFWAAPRQAYGWSTFALVLILVGGAGLSGGPVAMRAALFPAGALWFAIPTPLTERLAPAMAAQVAALAAQAAGMIGVPVVRAGVQLSVADGSYSVGGPCSGLRSLLALVALAYVSAGMGRSHFGRRVVVVALAVPLALAANWLRLTGLLVFTHEFGSARGLSIFEGPASPVLFGAAMAVIVALCWRFDGAEPIPRAAESAHADHQGGGSPAGAAGEGGVGMAARTKSSAVIGKQNLALMAGAGVVALAWLGVRTTKVAAAPIQAPSDTYVLYADVAGWYQRTPDEVAVVSPFDLTLDQLPSSLPFSIPPWQGEDRAADDDVALWLADPEVAVTRTYTRADGAVVWLSAFGSRGDRSFHLFEHTPITCYPLSGWVIDDLALVPLDIGPRSLTVQMGRATATDGELAFATVYLWRSPSRDASEGIVSLRLAAPVVGNMTYADARAALTDDFLPRLFLTTLPWSPF